MKQGLDWYKREPVAYLGGVQGLSAREHAVYSVVLDLIYVHAGRVNNDPRWIAGWISDMGAAAVRRTIESLVEKGKLRVEGAYLTQHRAREDAKARAETREAAAAAGRAGGRASGTARRKGPQGAPETAENPRKTAGKPGGFSGGRPAFSGGGVKENNGLAEATASSREEKSQKERGVADAPPLSLAASRGRAPPDETDAAFEAFWNAYPHRGGAKKGKAPARRKWRAAVKSGVPPSVIIEAAKAHHADRRVVDGYARDPATWLNQRGWEDEIEPAAPTQGGKGHARSTGHSGAVASREVGLAAQRLAAARGSG